MYEVQYACVYRPVWYSDSEPDHSDYQSAYNRAVSLHQQTGRSVRVVESSRWGDRVVLRLDGQQHPGL